MFLMLFFVQKIIVPPVQIWTKENFLMIAKVNKVARL